MSASKYFTMAVIAMLLAASSACRAVGDREAVSAETLDTMNARLKHLEDREEIRRLLTDYGRFLDRRDFESFAFLFAENDGEWIGGMGKAKGRQAIRRLMEETIGTNAPEAAPGNFHLFTNDRIDLDGDSAVAETKWVFVLQNASGRPEPFYLGHYEDEFVRQQGRWKFLRRVAYADIPPDNPETGRTE